MNLNGTEYQLIKIWCEYDISGEFGGNNDEDVLLVDEDFSVEEIEKEVLSILRGRTDLDEEDLDGLWGWEGISATVIRKED